MSQWRFPFKSLPIISISYTKNYYKSEKRKKLNNLFVWNTIFHIKFVVNLIFIKFKFFFLNICLKIKVDKYIADTKTIIVIYFTSVLSNEKNFGWNSPFLFHLKFGVYSTWRLVCVHVTSDVTSSLSIITRYSNTHLVLRKYQLISCMN